MPRVFFRDESEGEGGYAESETIQAKAFAKAIEDPTTAVVPYVYRKLLVMDTFSLTNDQVRELGVFEFRRMVNYAWLKLSIMRPDLPWKDGGKGKGRKTQTSKILWYPDEKKEFTSRVK